MFKENIILILFVSFFLIGCNETEQKNNKPDIKIVKIQNLNSDMTVKNFFEYPAQIYPFRNTTMAFEVSGKIVKFNFNVGDYVKKGDIIAKLDNDIFRSNYDTAQTNFNQSKIDYIRYKQLLESKTISISQFEKVKQIYDLAKASFDIAKKNLENTKLIAEFDGIIATKYVDDFERIVEKQKIIELQDNSNYKVKFFIPENDIVQSNKKIRLKDVEKYFDIFVTILGNTDLKYKAKLLDLSTQSEKITRTYEATVLIKKPNNINILPGMTAKVKALKKMDNTIKIYIPFQSIMTNHTNNSFVWIVDQNNSVKKTEIQIGIVKGSLVEVKKGLSQNDKIVTSGIHFLQENDKVEEYQKLSN